MAKNRAGAREVGGHRRGELDRLRSGRPRELPGSPLAGTINIKRGSVSERDGILTLSFYAFTSFIL